MGRPRHELQLTQDHSGRTPVWKLGLWILPLGLIVLLGMLPIHPSLSSDNRWRLEQLYELVMGEDGLVEWLQFVLLLACAFGVGRCCLRAQLRLRLVGKNPLVNSRFFALAVVLGFLVLAGEEISWGQRIFGIQTPEALKGINAQGEINIHNLQGLRTGLNGLLLTGNTILLVLSLWKTHWVPVALAPAFLVTTAYWISRLFTEDYNPVFVVRNGEWAELSMTLGICLLVYHWVPLRHSRSSIEESQAGVSESLAESA